MNDDNNSSRKRVAATAERDSTATSPSPSTTLPDERSPIITSAHPAPHKHYDSISPALSARDQPPTTTTTTTTTHTNGTGTTRRASAEREAADVERREGGWWRATWEKYGSVELENKGSVARDHLALERTFLAWLRTSLSFASIGIAITQLFRLNTSISPAPQSPSTTSTSTSTSSSSSSPSSQLLLLDTIASLQQQLQQTSDSPHARLRHLGKPLGATFLAISILVLFIGFHRYFEAQHYVIRGKFPASRGSILVVSSVSGVLIVSSLVIILATAPVGWER